MIKIFSTILLGTIISINLNANENEISSYSILKYQADFSKQTPQLQESITNEYLRVKKIATILQNQEMKNELSGVLLQLISKPNRLLFFYPVSLLVRSNKRSRPLAMLEGLLFLNI